MLNVGIDKLGGLICLITLVSFMNIKAQKGDCLVQSQDVPRYRIAQSSYTVGGDKTLVLYVSISPKSLNRHDMIALACKLKMVYKDENKVQAVFFTRYSAAKNFDPHPHSKNYESNWEAMRGGYFLNRLTGEEYVSFSTPNKKPLEEERIELGIVDGSDSPNEGIRNR